MVLMTSTACNSALQRVGLGGLARRIVATPYVPLDEPTPTPVPTNFSTAALVKLRSKLRVGIRFDAPPLASINKAGEVEGLEVDLVREMARRWLGSAEKNIEFVQVTSLSAPRRIKNRELDLALGGLTISRVAEAEADFSIPYYTDGEAVLVRTNTYADFASMAQKDIIYIDGQSLPALSAGQIAANITVTFHSEVSYANAVQALLDGRTDGVLGRWRRFRVLAQRDPAFQVLAPLSQEPVAIMLPHNDSQWADLVNLTLSAMIADGFYAKAHQKWFGVAPEPIQTIAPAQPPTLAQLANELPQRNTLARIKNTNSVRIGYIAQSGAQAVLAAMGADGQPTGYEIDVTRNIAQLLQPGSAISFVPLQTSQLAQALAAGSVDLAVGAISRNSANELTIDTSTLLFRVSEPLVQANPTSPLAPFQGSAYVIALPTNDSVLRDAVNSGLAAMRSDGTLETIQSQWFAGGSTGLHHADFGRSPGRRR
jgi:ABC-type amino acid transport substrate-binding protein